VVEQDPAGAKDAVALAVVHRHPVGVEFGHAVRATRPEGGVFALWYRLDLAEHLRGAGLVEPGVRFDQSDRLEQMCGADAGDLRGGGRLRKAHADKTLRRKVVDLVRLCALYKVHRTTGIGEVVLDHMQVRMLCNPDFLQSID